MSYIGKIVVYSCIPTLLLAGVFGAVNASASEPTIKDCDQCPDWNIFPAWVRTGYRYGLQGQLRASNLGFRVMRVVR